MRIAAVTAAIGVGILVLALWGRGRSLAMAPDFALPDLAGQAIRLSAYRGQVVLVNLWATWCPPCREEMPSMERLYQRLKDRGFVLLAVSQDEGDVEGVKKFAKEMKITFPVLVDPQGDVGRNYGVWGYPESFLLDRSGRIVERVIGPRTWDTPKQVAAIEALLATDTGVSGTPGH
ncbi:MAG TPA: TlpA disulfide reductase family protein [Candidatus Eisenbacteria bacterium]|nr:TlpA disulfide reductase family protein [Candidatus Eisenbacteria bacterium]